MPSPTENPDRPRLARLAEELRTATFDALERRWLLAQALDESRNEIERLLMIESVDSGELRRIVVRAEIMLDTWRGLSGRQSAKAR